MSKPDQPQQPVSVDLLYFYDDFVDFQSRCAFFCDATTALMKSDQPLDKATLEGMHQHAGQIKAGLNTLKQQLQQLRQKAEQAED